MLTQWLNSLNNADVSYDEKEKLRLMLLENAVINYGGGVHSLIARSECAAKRLQDSDPVCALLLKDIHRYLRDVVKAGKLEIPDWGVSSEK